MITQTKQSLLRKAALAVAVLLAIGTAAAPASASAGEFYHHGYWGGHVWVGSGWRFHHPYYFGPGYAYPPVAFGPAPGVVIYGR
jgi:hypothetical protein